MSMAPPPPQAPPPPRPLPPQPAAPPPWLPPAPEHEQPGHAAHEPHGEHGEHEAGHRLTRLALVLALSIAVVSVLGAIVGWRAETHASRASRYEQDAVAASITKAQLSSEADAAAATAGQDYDHYVRLGNEAARLDPAGCTDESQKTIGELEAGTACDMQTIFSAYDNSEYVVGGTFDAHRFTTDYIQANDYKSDTDVAGYEARASDERHHEDHMLYLSLGLVIALALLTLSRLGASRTRTLLLAVPGWLCLLGGAVLLGMLEV